MLNIKYFILLALTSFFHFVIYASSLTINIHYVDRPPYFIVSENKVVGGDIFEVLEKISKLSGIKFNYEEVPLARSMIQMDTRSDLICSGSSFKTEERFKKYKFSLPIFMDDKTVVSFRKERTEFLKFKTSKDIIESNFKPVLKIGFSYGQIIDEYLFKIKLYDHGKTQQGKLSNVETTTKNVENMLNLILNKDADYMFIGKNEYDYFYKTNNDFKEKLNFIYLSDLPLGEKRYLMCSKNVDNKAMELLNNAIKKLKLF